VGRLLPEGSPVDRNPAWPSKDHVTRALRQKLVTQGMLVRPAGSTHEGVGPHFEGPQRVLIADDYSDTAESLALLLRLAGLETQIAKRGDDAIRQAMQWHPQICVLDIHMPGCNGRDVARCLRGQSWAQRPLLIALTGWTSADERSQTLDAGFDYYFIKPVEPARLVRIIQCSVR
jgi:CheY-like chemotaxis protein